MRDRLRAGASGEIAAEQKRNFSPYSKLTVRGKGQPWTLKVFCLSSKDATRVPCSFAEREVLVQAGLGEKKATVPDINCSTQEFQSVLTSVFPKLEHSGGFDLLRCIPNTKDLEVINTVVAQSPKLLKSVVGSGRVFIRPIQRSLSMDVDEELRSVQASHCMSLLGGPCEKTNQLGL